MRKTLVLALILQASVALAAGPGPLPQPWGVAYPNLYYDNGGIMLPSTVPGGGKGPGTLNLGAGLFVNGSPFNFNNLAGVVGCSQEPLLLGDVSSSGCLVTVNKTNGVAFATIATSGSATDLVTGTLAASRLPAFAGGDVNCPVGSVVCTIGSLGGKSIGPSAISFNVQRFNVTFFGADPTGTTDSCVGLTAAKNALQAAGGGRLLLPSGTYQSSCAVAFATTPVSVMGEGMGNTIITFTSPTSAGFSIPANTVTQTNEVRDMTILTAVNQASGNPAIKVSYSVPNATGKGPSFQNLDIRGVGNNFYWARGIDCYSCTAGTVNNVTVAGKNVGAPALITPYSTPMWSSGVTVAAESLIQNGGNVYITYSGGTTGSTAPTQTSGTVSDGGVSWTYEAPLVPNMDRAISVDALNATAGGSQDFKINDLHTYYAGASVYVDNDSEGLSCIDCNGVAVNWGVFNGPQAISGKSQSVSQFVLASHFNSMLGGIWSPGCLQEHYNINTFYKWDHSTSNWIGVGAPNGGTSAAPVGCTQTEIDNNTFYGFHGLGATAGTAIAVALGSYADWNGVDANNATLVDYFADESNGSSAHNHFRINSGQLFTYGWFANYNLNSAKALNYPALLGNDPAVPAFGLNATQANVGGLNQKTFSTNATVPTTVTDLFGLQYGETVTIRCGDTNTTFAQASGVRASAMTMAGGTAYTCPRIQATITFRQADVLIETGRAN